MPTGPTGGGAARGAGRPKTDPVGHDGDDGFWDLEEEDVSSGVDPALVKELKSMGFPEASAHQAPLVAEHTSIKKSSRLSPSGR